MSSVSPTIILHGGAWAIPADYVDASVEGIKAAAKHGYQQLITGCSAVDAVEAAVSCMEDNPVFNAGYGSVLTSGGELEMDSLVMEGRELRAGAVACVQGIANPVQLARQVMDKTDHTLIVGAGAREFAREMGIPEVSTQQLLTPAAKLEYETFLKFRNAVKVEFRPSGSDAHCDTVGAVAVDSEGNVAAATSTGGITAKRPGRVGDSPLIGSGGYADNTIGAVSTTGHGEAISKVCLAHYIIRLMQTGLSAQASAEQALQYMSERVHGHGGAIVVHPTGEIGKHFTTVHMPWAAVNRDVMHYGINPQDDYTETLQH